MGRCDRNRIFDGKTPMDSLNLLVNLDDYAHLHERRYANVENENANSLRIIDFNEKIKQQQDNLHKILRIFFLNCGFWHNFLDSYMCYLLDPEISMPPNECESSCPSCLGLRSNIIMPVRREVI